MMRRILVGLMLASAAAITGTGCDSTSYCMDQCSTNFPTDAAARSRCQLDCSDKKTTAEPEHSTK